MAYYLHLYFVARLTRCAFRGFITLKGIWIIGSLHQPPSRRSMNMYNSYLDLVAVFYRLIVSHRHSNNSIPKLALFDE
jgi:hypothetical protein